MSHQNQQLQSLRTERNKHAHHKVTTLGTNVDGHVRSIEFDYDDLGRRDTVTSYANSEGTVRNEVVMEGGRRDSHPFV